jgi:hypothetical protein
MEASTMSSALAMILTAAMAIPGDGPEKVSAEMEQGLDLSGTWKGFNGDRVMEDRFKLLIAKSDSWVDEGAGQVRFKIRGLTYYGMYEQRGDRLKICFAGGGKDRPTRFQGGCGQTLIIVHRVKPRK